MASTGKRRKADLKVVILGSSNIGKTALISRYIDGKFSSQSEQTIGASFSLKQWGPYNVALWDTAGGERFMGLSSFYCRSAGAAILAYDLSDTETFEALSTRFIPLLQSAEEDCLCVVVGTKSDLLTPEMPPNSRVSLEQGVNLARQLNKSRHFDNNVPYFETSSLANQHVDDVFEYVFQTVLPLDKLKMEDMRSHRSGSRIELTDSKPGAKSTGKEQKKCC